MSKQMGSLAYGMLINQTPNMTSAVYAAINYFIVQLQHQEELRCISAIPILFSLVYLY